MKREPTLADLLLRPNVRQRYAPPRLAMLTAKRFVFDYAASEFMGTILRKTARLVLREHEFARTPYPQTWIELDGFGYCMGISGKVDNPEAADTKFGFLFNNGRVHFAAYSPLGVDWTPATILLHRPMSVEDELALAQRTKHSRLTLRQALIGYAEHLGHQWWNEPEAKALVRSHTYVPEPSMSDRHCYEILRAHQGVLKQMLAALLLLTRPGRRVLQFGEEHHQRAILKGKNMVMVKHNTVQLHIDQSVAIRRFISGIHTGLHRKEHDVRGHWAQTRRFQNNCTHNWDPVDVDHYRCLRCEAKRWWRHDHKRGRIQEGSISKDYEVTT